MLKLYKNFFIYYFCYKRRFVYNVKRTIQWLPIIWKDRDWDYAYLLILLKEKLTRMKKDQLENRQVSSKRKAESIGEAISCLERLIEENYVLKHESLESAGNARKKDLQKLTKIINDHLFSWWS